jgi:two-component system chemotaxis response regulator CheY
MRQQVRQCLEDNGFKVLEACDGAQGLEQARDTELSMIISDINMPNMNGIEMIAHVRRLPQHQRTPILVLSAEHSVNAPKRAKKAGASGWLNKPLKPKKLLGAVNVLTRIHNGDQ